jgi:PIN domain nuclease of toxin-antitoxin system
VSDVRVLDASAVLAYIQQEVGHESVEAALDDGPCWITAVNACEVLGKLAELGRPSEEAEAAFDALELIEVAFDAELARLSAFMEVRTRPIGASLGDRACLALAERTSRTQATPTVYTAERNWAKLKWPFKLVLIR